MREKKVRVKNAREKYFSFRNYNSPGRIYFSFGAAFARHKGEREPCHFIRPNQNCIINDTDRETNILEKFALFSARDVTVYSLLTSKDNDRDSRQWMNAGCKYSFNGIAHRITRNRIRHIDFTPTARTDSYTLFHRNLLSAVTKGC